MTVYLLLQRVRKNFAGLLEDAVSEFIFFCGFKLDPASHAFTLLYR